MPLDFQIKPFEQLDVQLLYKILQLRNEVFIVEQDCVYQDIDDKDQIALHVFGKKEGEIIAYARIFTPGDYFEQASIGRVLVKKSERKHGYGHQLMRFANEAVFAHFKTHTIKISAQEYLEKFYNAHGYQRVGDGYLEDGIPHIGMEKSSPNPSKGGE